MAVVDTSKGATDGLLPAISSSNAFATALAAARGDTPAGTVGELQQKHLLALNLRSVSDADALFPRAYYLPCLEGCRAASDERNAWKIDFMVSQAAAVLASATAHSIREPLDSICATETDLLAVAVIVCERFLVNRQLFSMMESEWLLLAKFDFKAQLACSSENQREYTRELLQRLQKQCPMLQLDLLKSNVWLVKPSTGALGRGIAFIKGLDSTGEPMTMDAGKQRRANHDDLGYIIQKYIERPHLIEPATLLNCVGGSAMVGSEFNIPSGISVGSDGGSYKYGIRLWLEVLWSSTQPEAWIYEQGYIDFADRPYTDELAISTAHVTNLSLPPSPGESFQTPIRLLHPPPPFSHFIEWYRW